MTGVASETAATAVAATNAIPCICMIDLPVNRACYRATGVLCVYGSGFGTRPEDGFFRIVFLADPRELSEIYDLMAGFTSEFLARGVL